MTRSRILQRLLWIILGLVGILGAAALSAPLWLKPLAEHQASIAFGRPVEIMRVGLSFGSPLMVTAESIVIGNPAGFPPGEEALLRIPRLILQVEAGTYLRRREIVVPLVELDKPVARIVSMADGRSNFAFGRGGAFPRIDAIRVHDGRIRLSLAKLRAELEINVSTEDATARGDHAIVAAAHGTYAGEPMTAGLLAGGVSGLGGLSTAWPVELNLVNGPTRASVKGTLQAPLDLRAATLGLLLAGPDLALLTPLIGIPLPVTPPYELGGKLDYTEGRAHFSDVAGHVGGSDVEGTLTVTRGQGRPELKAELRSQSVDLLDIASLISGGPGPPGTPGQTPGQQDRAAQVQRQSSASPRLLPDRRLNLQKLRTVDMHLAYRAERIQGRSMPLDDLTLHMDVVDGAMTLRPLSFGVGDGRITADVSLNPDDGDTVRAEANVRFERLDLARLMHATGTYRGTGALSGRARVEGTGRSVAEILGHGDGTLILSMAGGELSSLLVNLAGLRLGSTLLGSLGGEARTPVECFVADLPLRHGILSTRALLLETANAVTEGQGTVDLGRERVEVRLQTQSKRLTVGTLPVPLRISGTLKSLSAAPEGMGTARGGIGGALAALPTIRLGIGDDTRCNSVLRRMHRENATGTDAPHAGSSSGSGRH